MKVGTWILSIVMAFVLFSGHLLWSNALWSNRDTPLNFPKNINELEKVRVKISSFKIGMGYQTLMPQEYHVNFYVPAPPIDGVYDLSKGADYKPRGPKINYVVRIGSDADVYLRKEDLKILDDNKYQVLKIGDNSPVYIAPENKNKQQGKGAGEQPNIIAYGIVMADGEVIADPRAVITGSGLEYQRHVGLKQVAVACTYFFILSIYLAFSYKRKGQQKNDPSKKPAQTFIRAGGFLDRFVKVLIILILFHVLKAFFWD